MSASPSPPQPAPKVFQTRILFSAQADALEIEAQAKRPLADEYDAAQPEGAEKGGRPKTVPDGNGFTAASVGLTRPQIHEARQIRDAERMRPGVVRETLDEKLAAGEEPTKAALRARIARCPAL